MAIDFGFKRLCIWAMISCLLSTSAPFVLVLLQFNVLTQLDAL